MIPSGWARSAWYYAHALRPHRAVRGSRRSRPLSSRAQGEMPLPSLGRIELPTAVADGIGGCAFRAPTRACAGRYRGGRRTVAADAAGAIPGVAGQLRRGAHRARRTAPRGPGAAALGAVLARESESQTAAHAILDRACRAGIRRAFHRRG